MKVMKKVVKKKKKLWFKPKGKLRGWSIDKSQEKRRHILDRLVRKLSYATVVRKLNALRNVSTSKETDRKAKADMEYLRKKYR